MNLFCVTTKIHQPLPPGDDDDDWPLMPHAIKSNYSFLLHPQTQWFVNCQNLIVYWVIKWQNKTIGRRGIKIKDKRTWKKEISSKVDRALSPQEKCQAGISSCDSPKKPKICFSFRYKICKSRLVKVYS